MKRKAEQVYGIKGRETVFYNNKKNNAYSGFVQQHRLA